MTGLLHFDIALAFDFVFQVVAYGAGRYFREWTFFKLGYGLSFFYIFHAYGVGSFVYKPIDLALRCYRILILIKIFTPSELKKIKLYLFNRWYRVAFLMLISLVIYVAYLPVCNKLSHIKRSNQTESKGDELVMLLAFYNNFTFALSEYTN